MIIVKTYRVRTVHDGVGAILTDYSPLYRLYNWNII